MLLLSKILKLEGVQTLLIKAQAELSFQTYGQAGAIASMIYNQRPQTLMDTST